MRLALGTHVVQPGSEDDPLADEVVVELVKLESFLACGVLGRVKPPDDAPFRSWLWCRGSLP